MQYFCFLKGKMQRILYFFKTFTYMHTELTAFSLFTFYKKTRLFGFFLIRSTTQKCFRLSHFGKLVWLSVLIFCNFCCPIPVIKMDPGNGPVSYSLSSKIFLNLQM